MELSERISRGVKATFGANILDVAANGLLIIILARYLLTPDEYGLLYFAISILGVVGIFGTLGLPSSIARYVTEYTESDPTQLRYILSFSLLVLVTLSGIVGLVVTLSSPLIATYLGEPGLAPLLALGIAYIFLQAMRKYLSKSFQGLNRVDYSALVSSISAVGRIVFVIAFVLLGFGVVGALAGYVAGFFVAVAIGFIILYWNFYRTYEATQTPEAGLRKRILEYSVPLTATRGATVLDKQVDTILVGIFLTPAAVGFYTIAKQVSEVCITPAQALGFTVSPAYGEQQAGDRGERAARLYEQSLEGVLLLYVPAVVGLVLVAEPMIRYVFGPEYLDAVPVLQIMALYVLANAINRITSDGLDFLGRARARAIVKSITAIANVILNILLIPTIGLIGAPIATVITYSIYAGANVFIIGTELPIQFGTAARTTLGVSTVSVVMGACVYLLLPHVSGLISLFAVVGLGVAVWALLGALGGLLDFRKAVEFFV